MGELRRDGLDEFDGAEFVIDKTAPPVEPKSQPIRRINPNSLPRWRMKPLPKRDGPPPTTTPDSWVCGDVGGDDAA